MNLTEKENLFEALVFSLGDQYDKLMLHEFVDYWSEPNKSKTKMRWELEKTWDIKRRLKTWFNNNQKWSKQSLNGTYNTHANGQGGYPTKTGIGKINGEQLNEAFAKFYKGK